MSTIGLTPFKSKSEGSDDVALLGELDCEHVESTGFPIQLSDKAVAMVRSALEETEAEDGVVTYFHNWPVDGQIEVKEIQRYQHRRRIRLHPFPCPRGAGDVAGGVFARGQILPGLHRESKLQWVPRQQAIQVPGKDMGDAVVDDRPAAAAMHVMQLGREGVPHGHCVEGVAAHAESQGVLGRGTSSDLRPARHS